MTGAKKRKTKRASLLDAEVVSKAPQQQRLVIKTAGSAEEEFMREEAAIEKQNQLARDIADGIERGELPSAQNKRQFIALILRTWADRVRPERPAKRGNPSFIAKAKIYDPDRVALEVGFKIAFGDTPIEAVAAIADDLEVDVSTIPKIFRPRRAAVAQWFVNTNLAHRVGAILGE